MFRREAVEHRVRSWLGCPQIATSIGEGVWAVVAFFVVVSIALFVVVGTYNQKVRLSGRVVYQPAVAYVSAMTTGVIVQSFAEEGKKVRAGDVIFIVSAETNTEYGRTKQEVVLTLKSQQAAVKREIKLRAKTSDAERHFFTDLLLNKESELKALDKLLSRSEAQVLWLLDKAKLYDQLVREGLGVDRERVERRSEYYTASVQLEVYRRERVKLQGEVVGIKRQLSALDNETETKLEALRRQSARLNQNIVLTEEGRELHITSPIDGTLTGVVGSIGSLIRATQELASVVPSGGYAEVELFASGEAVGELRKGQAVRLRFDAYPYQWFGQYSGIVSSVSIASVAGRSGGVAGRGDKPYFQVRVKPKSGRVVMAGQFYPLKPGMGVEADIYLRKRSIYEWLISPLKRARAAIQSKPGGAT